MLRGTLAVGVLGPCARRAAAQDASLPGLVIVDRADSFRDDALVEFEQRTRVALEYQIVDEAQLYARVLSDDPFDVIVVPDRLLDRLAQEERLAPLDHDRLPGLANISGDFAEPVYDPGMRFGAPYLWGTWGIGYTDLRASRPRDWDELLQADTYANDINLPAVPELIRLFMKIDGGSANATDPVLIEAAERRIAELRPRVRSFAVEKAVDELAVGRVAMAVIESRRIQPRLPSDGTLGYVVPRSGTILTVDSLAIGRGARDPDVAHAFVDFVLDPERQARTATSLRAGCPNGAGLVYVPQEMRLDRSIYPPRETLQRCETMRWAGAATEQLYADAARRIAQG